MARQWVSLESGEELRAGIVVSNLDAKRTFTKIMDRNDLPPGIYEKAKNFKIRGSSGKVNIALSGCPNSPVCPTTATSTGAGRALPVRWKPWSGRTIAGSAAAGLTIPLSSR